MQKVKGTCALQLAGSAFPCQPISPTVLSPKLLPRLLALPRLWQSRTLPVKRCQRVPVELPNRISAYLIGSSGVEANRPNSTLSLHKRLLLLQLSLAFSRQRRSAFLIRLVFTQHRSIRTNPFRHDNGPCKRVSSTSSRSSLSSLLSYTFSTSNGVRKVSIEVFSNGVVTLWDSYVKGKLKETLDRVTAVRDAPSGSRCSTMHVWIPLPVLPHPPGMRKSL